MFYQLKIQVVILFSLKINVHYEEMSTELATKKMIMRYEISIMHGYETNNSACRFVFLPKSKWVLKLECLLKSN